MTTATQKSDVVLKWEKQWHEFKFVKTDEIINDKELHFFLSKINWKF